MLDGHDWAGRALFRRHALIPPRLRTLIRTGFRRLCSTLRWAGKGLKANYGANISAPIRRSGGTRESHMR